MIEEHGDDAMDLLHAQLALPGEDPTADERLPDRERKVRLLGSRAIGGGLAVIGGTALAVTATPEHTVDRADVLVSCTLIGAGMALGAALLAAGLVEKITQYGRTQGRRAILGQEATARERAVDRVTLRRQLDLLTGLTAPLPVRMAALERSIERVPTYIEGVTEGIELRRSIIGDID